MSCSSAGGIAHRAGHVRFAIDVQRAMVERNAQVPEDRRITYRVGINIGDIIVDGDDIYV